MRTILLLTALAMCAQARADRVMLRENQPAIEGRITVVNEDGITIDVPDAQQRVISWDRVAEFQTSRTEASADEYRALAQELWRARSRVERGDTKLALPVFEQLESKYRGRTSETALVVMEGLLRSRLDQGANDLALIPALEVARLRLKGLTTTSYSALAPVLDEATKLCPVLPPVWAQSPVLMKTERALADYDSGNEPLLTAHAKLYRQAMRKQLGLSVESEDSAKLNATGVELLSNILETGSPAPDVRQGGRERLLRQTQDLGDWAQAWAKYFVGASLLMESGGDSHRAGIVSLLTVPARFWATQPYLAGLALAKSSDALAASGDIEAAAAVDEELRRTMPNHPVIVAGSHRPISRSPKESS